MGTLGDASLLACLAVSSLGRSTETLRFPLIRMGGNFRRSVLILFELTCEAGDNSVDDLLVVLVFKDDWLFVDCWTVCALVGDGEGKNFWIVICVRWGDRTRGVLVQDGTKGEVISD